MNNEVDADALGKWLDVSKRTVTELAKKGIVVAEEEEPVVEAPKPPRQQPKSQSRSQRKKQGPSKPPGK